MGGFRGDLLYNGLIPVTFEIPSVGFSLTFSVNVIATPRIEIVGEKGTGVDFEIVVALIHVPKYDVVCNDNYDKTKYGAEYIPTPTNVEWNITSGSDCFYLVPDTSSTSYYATYKVKSIPDGYIDWVNNQTGDLILGISAGWMDYTVNAEKVYKHLSDY